MSPADLLIAAKLRLGIPSSNTTWDSLLGDSITAAVRRLFPRVQNEVPRQEVSDFSVDNEGECDIDLTALTSPLKNIRKLEAYDGSAWFQLSKTYIHANTLTVREVDTSVTRFRIYGLTAYATSTELPDHLIQPVIWLAMSEYYDYLAGSKSSYNSYSQLSGARAVDNMADESERFENKALNELADQAQIYGH